MDTRKPTAECAQGISICRALCRLVWGLVLVLLIVYGLLQAGVRTDAFRRRVERELSQATGMEMRVGRIRATESLNLRIRDVISMTEDGGLEARLIRVRWRIFRPRGEPMLEAVRVSGLALTFAPDAAGALQPAFLGAYARTAYEWAGVRLADKAGAPAAASPEPSGKPSRREGGRVAPQVILEGMSVRFEDAKGNFQGAMSGMQVAWTSMRLPDGGRISHLDCRAAEVRLAGGPRITGLRVKLIDTGERQYLAALEAADWGAAAPLRNPEAEYRELLDMMDADLR
jgi:hypothetical protein